MAFPNCIGHKRFWTRERVLSSLIEAVKEIRGPLPCSDSAFNRIKKGRLEWPTSHRVLEFFGSMARGWIAARASKKRVSLKNIEWTSAEDLYLLDHAGVETLAQIGTHLGRS